MLLFRAILFLVKERPIGGYRSWFLQYPIFQNSCKTVSELIQTDYLWAPGLSSRKRASHGLMYYCPETPPPAPSGKNKQECQHMYLENFPPGALCKQLIILWEIWEHLSCHCLPKSDKFCLQTIFLNYFCNLIIIIFFPTTVHKFCSRSIFTLEESVPWTSLGLLWLGYWWYPLWEINENLYFI